MKILIVGVNGMLGNALARAAKNFDITGTYNNFFLENNFNDIKLDIGDHNSVIETVKTVSPDLVVNCAAISNVDLCEDSPSLAKKVHVDGTKNLSEACGKINAKFIHISTDFVFDGFRGNYTEHDECNPVNIYGKSKLDGEKTLSKNDLLIRTCIFGKNVENKKSMLEWIVDDLKNGKKINVMNDSFFTPIYTGHLARVILQMFESDMKGIYHIASSKRIDKFSFAKAVAEIFDLDANLIGVSSIKDFVRKAKRPVDTSLDVKKALSQGIKLQDYKEEIRMMKHEWY